MKCYGCGQRYDASDGAESVRHTNHAGDSGVPRERLLAWLDECQGERDELARRLAAMGAGESTDDGDDEPVSEDALAWASGVVDEWLGVPAVQETEDDQTAGHA